jgi:hypothetical protein
MIQNQKGKPHQERGEKAVASKVAAAPSKPSRIRSTVVGAGACPVAAIHGSSRIRKSSIAAASGMVSTAISIPAVKAAMPNLRGFDTGSSAAFGSKRKR